MRVPDFLLRGIDGEIAEKVKTLARERNWAINDVLLHLIRQALGLVDAEQPTRQDIAMLGGTWGNDEAEAFKQALKAFENLPENDSSVFAAFEHDRQWLAPVGGDTRARSVANGLAALRERGATDADWVLVHDAARCLLRPAWVDRLIDACGGDAVGGLLALPLADTLKQAESGRVRRTLARADKWLAQTPQMFRLGLLQRALAQAGSEVTDEASAVEALGHAPRLVPGELENFKITWPQDLALAGRLLRTREAGA